MHKYRISLKKYETSTLIVGKGALSSLYAFIKQGNYTSVTIVTDRRVLRLHGRACRAALRTRLPLYTIVLPPGERTKDFTYAEQILARLARAHVDRHGALLALGGGVVGDVAGFAASVYLRGIDCIQAPTTLLAQVDSAIGGKTGVDFRGIKNVAGTFSQPRAIVCDVSLLSTLPRKELVNGMAEVIKYGFIGSRAFVNRLQKYSLEQMPWEGVVRFCAHAKARVVIQDQFDRKGMRARLNFGHTVGHALETLSDFSLPHGKAISIGMVAAARISSKVLGLSRQECERVEALLTQYGLPTRLPPRTNINRVIDVLRRDKKAKGGKVKWVLLKKIGKVKAGCIVDEKIVKQVLGELKD